MVFFEYYPGLALVGVKAHLVGSAPVGYCVRHTLEEVSMHVMTNDIREYVVYVLLYLDSRRECFIYIKNKENKKYWSQNTSLDDSCHYFLSLGHGVSHDHPLPPVREVRCNPRYTGIMQSLY
jgi:hypothetical protein